MINFHAEPKYGPLSADDKAAIQEIITLWKTDPASPGHADAIIQKYEKMIETGWGRKAGTFSGQEGKE